MFWGIYFFLAGRGLPNHTRRGGAEVCVVLSSQRQGQVYLCDTANLGSSAHSRHHISEGGAGKTGWTEKVLHFYFTVNAAMMSVMSRANSLTLSGKKNLSSWCLFKSNGSVYICAKQLQGCKRPERFPCLSLFIVFTRRTKKKKKSTHLIKAHFIRNFFLLLLLVNEGHFFFFLMILSWL